MSRLVEIIGAPTDYGIDRRGVDMGPSAIRYAGLAEQLSNAGVDCLDSGDLTVPRAEERDPTANPLGDRAKFLAEVEDVSTRLADVVAESITSHHLPLILGGDHSIAIGTLSGLSRTGDIGVLWLDAHGDFNTPETTPSGNVHGMALAAALGRGRFGTMDWAPAAGLSAANVVLVGLRDLDPGERDALLDSPVSAYTMSDIDERGIADVIDTALADIGRDVDGLHLSFDLDVLDPNEAPGVGTPVRGGITYREAHAALETVAEGEHPIRSLEFVEVNPILDRHNATAELAAELVGSALGKRILR